MGKIGLTISPQADVIYAAIELNRRTGGVYRSENQGEEWVKMSDVFCEEQDLITIKNCMSLHNFDELYLLRQLHAVFFRWR